MENLFTSQNHHNFTGSRGKNIQNIAEEFHLKTLVHSDNESLS